MEKVLYKTIAIIGTVFFTLFGCYSAPLLPPKMVTAEYNQLKDQKMGEPIEEYGLEVKKEQVFLYSIRMTRYAVDDVFHGERDEKVTQIVIDAKPDCYRNSTACYFAKQQSEYLAEKSALMWSGDRLIYIDIRHFSHLEVLMGNDVLGVLPEDIREKMARISPTEEEASTTEKVTAVANTVEAIGSAVKEGAEAAGTIQDEIKKTKH